MIKDRKHFHVTLLLAPLLLLSGCLSTTEKQESVSVSSETDSAVRNLDDGSPVLMRIDGRPVLTVKSIDADFERLVEENPQFKQVLPFMPDAKMNFFKGMVSQQIIDEYIHRNGIDTSPEYQREYAKTIDQVKHMMNMNHFSERHPAEVSEAEVRRFYDENKDRIPDLMQSQGGVKAEGVSFTNEDDAKAFQAKAKEASTSFEKLAADAGYASHYNDFKLVNAQSMQIDPALKAKLMKVTSFPSVELINVGNEWWVVHAESKAEPTYVPFDNVKSTILDHLKKQKQMETFEKVIDTYKEKYGVEIDDAPLRASNPEQAMPEMMEETEEFAEAEVVVPVTRTA
jgi:hypothetical protein